MGDLKGILNNLTNFVAPVSTTLAPEGEFCAAEFKPSKILFKTIEVWIAMKWYCPLEFQPICQGRYFFKNSLKIRPVPEPFQLLNIPQNKQ